MSYRIAACCQLGEVKNDKFTQFDSCKMGTITVTSMAKLCGVTKDNLTADIIQSNFMVLSVKLLAKLEQNLSALRSQVLQHTYNDGTRKMFRISSDLLPLYTHPLLGALYDEQTMDFISKRLHDIGEMIDGVDLRVTSHPSQFTTLCSDKEHVIDNSIIDLEHHVMIFEKMGLTPADGVVINIHANGKSFSLPERAKHLFPWISLENDEKQAGHGKVLALCEQYGIRYVFDLHHYYCETGEYMPIGHEDVSRILATWGDQRPVFHLSQSRGSDSKRDLCAHSDIVDDNNLIEYTAQYLKYVDLDIEAKYKNVAADKFAQDVLKFL